MFKYYDQHIHSSYSRDSKEDIENYYKVAEEKELVISSLVSILTTIRFLMDQHGMLIMMI